MFMGEQFSGGALWHFQHGDGHLCSLVTISDKSGVREDGAFWCQTRCFGALAAGFAALTVGSHEAHMVQGTKRLLRDGASLAVPRLDSHARGLCTYRGVRGLLIEAVWVFSP